MKVELLIKKDFQVEFYRIGNFEQVIELFINIQFKDLRILYGKINWRLEMFVDVMVIYFILNKYYLFFFILDNFESFVFKLYNVICFNFGIQEFIVKRMMKDVIEVNVVLLEVGIEIVDELVGKDFKFSKELMDEI